MWNKNSYKLVHGGASDKTKNITVDLLFFAFYLIWLQLLLQKLKNEVEITKIKEWEPE